MFSSLEIHFIAVGTITLIKVFFHISFLFQIFSSLETGKIGIKTIYGRRIPIDIKTKQFYMTIIITLLDVNLNRSLTH